MADPQDDWGANDAVVPTGDDFLKTLDPARASQVKALAEGRMELPKGQALRSGPGAALLADVATYDPTFDAADAPARIAARKKFTSGTQGQNITSFNTAIGHIGSLAQAAEALDNSDFPMYNSIANSVGPMFGNTKLAGRLKDFGVAKQAVVEELGRAFKGAAPDVHGTKEWEKQINEADSPEALRHAVKTAAELLQSRITAQHDSYNAAMGTTDQPLPMLNQHANDALAAFQSPDYLEKGYGAIAAANATPTDGDGGGAPPAAPLLAPTGGPAPTGPAPLAADNLQISDGTSKAVDQTATKPIREGIARLVASGASANDIRAFIVKSGINPTSISGLDELVAFRKQHPEYKGGYDITIGPQNVDMSAGEGLAAQVAGSAPAAALVSSANTGLFGTLPKIVAGADAIGGRLAGDNRDVGTIYNAALGGANYKVNALKDAHPVAALMGDTAGFLAGDAALGALPGMARMARALPGAVRPIVGDALFGAATGLGSSDSLSDIPGNVAKSAALTGVGGIVGRGTVRGIANLASPVANAAVQRLTAAGVTLTPGQILGAGGGIVGRAVKGIEDRVAGFPIVGDIVNSTRRTGTEEFNRAAINDALAPLRQTLPANVPIGHDAIAHAQRVVSQAYDDALAPLHAQLDNQLVTDLQRVGQRVQGMAHDQRTAFAEIMDNDIAPYWPQNGVFNGEQLQAVKQGLDKEIARRQSPSASPSDQRLADRLEDIRDSVMGLAARSDPQNAAAFRQADQAHALLSRVNGAASKARDGVFTPNQFRQAVTKRGYGTTTASVARGDSRMQQLATDASTIMPSTVPDSGTAGRAALGMIAARMAPGAALGGAVGGYEGGSGGALTGALAGGALLSRPGARVFQAVAAGSRGRTLNTLGDLLRRNAGVGGAVGAPLLLSRLPNQGN